MGHLPSLLKESADICLTVSKTWTWSPVRTLQDLSPFKINPNDLG